MHILDDGNIKFYDLQKQNTKRGFRYLADTYPVRSIAFHPSGEFIISGTDHHCVRMFDIQSMKLYIPPSQNDHHLGAITRVRYAPNGATFASCSLDGSIKIYETVSGKCINTISKVEMIESRLDLDLTTLSCIYSETRLTTGRLL
jgi:cleavage stimulation factor subunit 1